METIYLHAAPPRAPTYTGPPTRHGYPSSRTPGQIETAKPGAFSGFLVCSCEPETSHPRGWQPPRWLCGRGWS